MDAKLLYNSRGTLRALTEGAVRADEVAYRQERAAEVRALSRALGIDPWRRFYPRNTSR
jgi:hypothetical protein